MKNSKIKTAVFVACVLSTTLCVRNLSAASAENVSKKITQVEQKINNSFDKEKIKKKFHETADSLTEQKINETVDEVADYLDPEKLKDTIDLIADHLDKEKMVQAIEIAAQYLDKERIKEWIDVASDYFDRDKVKEALVMMLNQIDKEKIKTTFDRGLDQVADALDHAIDSIKKDIVEAQLDAQSFKDHVDQYHLKNLIADKVSSDVITLSHLKLNGQNRVAIVSPGQQVHGEVICAIDREQCSSLSKYHVIVGIKHQSGQKPIYNHFGLAASREKNTFVLKAPHDKGVYRVGFQVVKTPLESTAVKNWEEENYETPTIGLIIVN